MHISTHQTDLPLSVTVTLTRYNSSLDTQVFILYKQFILLFKYKYICILMKNCAFHFLQASSKDVVEKTCQDAFLYRDRRKVPDLVVSNIAAQYNISQEQAKQVSNNQNLFCVFLLINLCMQQYYLPPNHMIQDIVFQICISVCLAGCLSVRLSSAKFNYTITF